MSFGYIGYIWALFGCCTLFAVFSGSAALLYGIGRRQERRDGPPSVTVERVIAADEEKPEGGAGA